MSAGGVERDFLLIEYADSDKLYVSLDQITLVQKYIGMEGRAPRIDALGKKSAWNSIPLCLCGNIFLTSRCSDTPTVLPAP